MNSPGVMAHPVTLVEMTAVMARTPTTSRNMPVRSTHTGPIRCARGAPMPLATNDPTANASSTTPTWRASYPITDCRNSGKVKSRPNSPRLTSAATRLPTPNVLIRNSFRSTNTTLPATPRRCSTRTNSAITITPPNSPTAAGEMLSKGHCQLPIWNCFLGVNHP